MFKKTTTATGTTLNKRFNEKSTGCAEFIAESQIQFRDSFDNGKQAK